MKMRKKMKKAEDSDDKIQKFNFFKDIEIKSTIFDDNEQSHDIENEDDDGPLNGDNAQVIHDENDEGLDDHSQAHNINLKDNINNEDAYDTGQDDKLDVANDVHDIQDKDTGDHSGDEAHDVGLAFHSAENLKIEQQEDGHFDDDNAHDIREENGGRVDDVGTQNIDPEEDGHAAAPDDDAHKINQGQDDRGSDRADDDSRDADGHAHGTAHEDDGPTYEDASEDGDSPDSDDNVHDIEYEEGGSEPDHDHAPNMSYTANHGVHITDEVDEDVVNDGHHVDFQDAGQKITDEDGKNKKVAVDVGSHQNQEDAEDVTKGDEDMDRDGEREDATEMSTVIGRDATDRDDDNITAKRNFEYEIAKTEDLPTTEDQSEEIKVAENVEKNDEEAQKTGIQVSL